MVIDHAKDRDVSRFSNLGVQLINIQEFIFDLLALTLQYPFRFLNCTKIVLSLPSNMYLQ